MCCFSLRSFPSLDRRGWLLIDMMRKVKAVRSGLEEKRRKKKLIGNSSQLTQIAQTDEVLRLDMFYNQKKKKKKIHCARPGAISSSYEIRFFSEGPLDYTKISKLPKFLDDFIRVEVRTNPLDKREASDRPRCSWAA